ncbi:MAG TPA: SET domain-containing protein-lysine N-methyltransferase [Vicinamibacterales bacterium]
MGAKTAKGMVIKKGRKRFNVATLTNPPKIERRKSKVHGWGVFALETIPKNKRIIDYAGELITAKQSSPREARYLKKGHIWCFTLNRRWVVDAAVGGNIARFINHSCKPNCYTEITDGTIWIRASRTIRKGEELSYNYHTDGAAEIPCRCRPGCKNQL